MTTRSYWWYAILIACMLLLTQHSNAAALTKLAEKVENVTGTNLDQVISNTHKGMTNVASQAQPLMAVLAKGMEKAGGYIEQAVDFTVEQAPLVVQEYATWTFATSLLDAFWCLLAALLFWSVVVYLTRLSKAQKYEPEGTDAEQNGWWACKVISLLCLVVSLWPMFYVCENLKEASKAKFAPRVLLIEKAVELYHQK